MSRDPRSPRRRLGAALLQACSALSLLACAHAVDNSAADSADSASDTTAGATGSAGSGAESGGASAGLGNASGSGDIAGQAQGGSAPIDAGAGAPGSAGQVAGAGAGAGAGGASVGSAGSGAVAGSSGSHLCKVTTDLNVYTPSNTGCGGYAACKGQIHWRNDEAQTLTKPVLSFSEPVGTTCTDDNATSKWTITDNGATSHRCVFTASATLTVASKSALSFGYDTNQTSSTAPTNISVADPSCN